MADNVHEFPRQPQPPAPRADGPSNPDAEAAVIGALLALGGEKHAASLSGTLLPHHFAEPTHGAVYAILLELLAAGKPLTFTILSTYLPQADIALGVSVATYIGRCIENAALPLHVRAYGSEIVDLHQRREILRISREMAEQALDPPPGTPSDALIEAAEASLSKLSEASVRREQTHGWAAGAAHDLIRFGEMTRAGEIPDQGTPTGIYKLDQATGGIQNGDLWIIGGRPGQGKSICGTSIAKGVALSDVKAWQADETVRRRGALFFSFELSKPQVTSRILADMAYLRSSPFQNPITFGDVMRGRVEGDAELWRLQDAAKRLDYMPLALDWSSRMTVPQIRSRVRREIDRMHDAGCQLRCVVLDYLKFIEASERYRGQRAQEVAEISGGLKQMAKDLGIGVVLLAQLNRQNEMRGDPRPVLSDLKESGDLEADADLVAFVYREEYYLQQSKGYKDRDPDAVDRYEAARGKMSLILAKNRAGATRTLELFCDVGSSMIDDHDRRM